MNNLISIIVPIYKVEKYLNRCIDSIINQTYKNIEIILIDDGSPDNCGVICDEYARKDIRIKVIHKKNGGLSEARNYGIEASIGEYIIFVDSDDYISNNMCELLLKNALKNNADIVSCNFKEIYFNNIEKINRQSQKQKNSIVSNIEAIYRYFIKNDLDMNVVWNKIYKRHLFFGKNRLRFPVGKLHEDDFIVYKFYYYANKIVIISDVLYYYFKHENSITGNFSEKNLLDKIEAVKEQYNFVKDKEISLKYMFQVRCIDQYKGFLCMKEKLFINKKIINEFLIDKNISDLRKYILYYKKSLFFNPYMNWKKYVKYILIYINAKYILKKL